MGQTINAFYEALLNNRRDTLEALCDDPANFGMWLAPIIQTEADRLPLLDLMSTHSLVPIDEAIGYTLDGTDSTSVLIFSLDNGKFVAAHSPNSYGGASSTSRTTTDPTEGSAVDRYGCLSRNSFDTDNPCVYGVSYPPVTEAQCWMLRHDALTDGRSPEQELEAQGISTSYVQQHAVDGCLA
ncbi:hypothetical protein ACQPX6_17465 [Actinomycetospora sp. CA-101289]|uniref:hypothetical protein n=1 Tax=Actinomycetospora sp. CA-101289 TaxID=3239893 RepID=UPI003D9753F8